MGEGKGVGFVRKIEKRVRMRWKFRVTRIWEVSFLKFGNRFLGKVYGLFFGVSRDFGLFLGSY